MGNRKINYIEDDEMKEFPYPKCEKDGIIIKEDGLYLNGNLVYESNRKRNLLGDHNLYNVASAILILFVKSFS